MPPASRNILLATLPRAERDLLLPALVPVVLRAGDVLESPDVGEAAVYFLESGLASMTVALGRDMVAEMAHVGRDGFCGVSVLLGGAPTGRTTHVRIGGTALLAEAGLMRNLVTQHPALRRHLMTYVHSLFAGFARSANCARRHPLPARLAARLLLLSQLIESRELPVTHEGLAGMLGVRRASISIAMRRLQTKGALVQHWGLVTLRDPVALRRASCGCCAAAPERPATIAEEARAPMALAALHSPT